jgi:hypothetical protein
LSSGKTVHGANLMPHEIVQHLLVSRDPVLESQLQNLVDEFLSSFPTEIGLILAMCDVSGSMTCKVAGSNAPCVDVSIALSFLLSRLPGPFHDKMLTFSADPIIIDLSDKASFYEKLQKIKTIWDGNSSSTDFGKAMDYILRSLIDSKVDPALVSELTLVVFSDMQFDQACVSLTTYYGQTVKNDPWDVAQERIAKMYTTAGFPVPKMVYWNLNARESAGHQAHAETKGVTMLSGFSQAALKSFLVGDLTLSVDDKGEKIQRTPYETLCLSLDKYLWLMKKFEEVCPGYLAPVEVEVHDDSDCEIPSPPQSPV